MYLTKRTKLTMQSSLKLSKDSTMNRLSKVTCDSEQAMSIKYNTMVYELKRKGINVTVLSLGEAFFDIPLFAMDDLPIPDIYHYSNSRGIPELREKLARYFLENYDVPIDPEQEIIVTAGSKIAIHITLMSILNPGDEVLLSEPTWVSYPEQIKLCYANPVFVPVNQTVYEFERYITAKTKAIIITNPNNPTGYVYKKEELEYLLKLARKHDLWLISDEAYSEFVNDDSYVSLGKLDKEKNNAIVFNSISKNYGISGWRLGYVICNKELMFNILKVNQHLITCPATILEYYIEKHFDTILNITRPQIAQVVEKRKKLDAYMKEIGLTPIEGTATFYFFVSIAPSKLTSEAFCTRLLEEEHICVVPGLGYGNTCDSYIRISIGTESMEQTKKALRTIHAFIQKTS